MAKKATEKKPLKLVPLGDRVVLKRDEADTKTAGGIVLPDSAKDKPQRGRIIAIGNGYVKRDGTRAPLTVKEGDRVIFNSYSGEEIKVDEDSFLLLRESDILCTF